MKALELIHQWLDDNGYCEGRELNKGPYDERLFIYSIVNLYDDGDGYIAIYGCPIKYNDYIHLNIKDPEFFAKLEKLIDDCVAWDQLKNKKNEATKIFY